MIWDVSNMFLTIPLHSSTLQNPQQCHLLFCLVSLSFLEISRVKIPLGTDTNGNLHRFRLLATTLSFVN